MALMCNVYLLSAQADSLLLEEYFVSGNKRTRLAIIAREIVLKEGKWYANEVVSAGIARSKENLMNTGLFNFVESQINYRNDTVSVDFYLTERWYTWPAPIFELVDPNFNTFWRSKDFTRTSYGLQLSQFNVRGANETLRFRLKLGYHKQFNLAYEIPYIDRNKQWGLGLFSSFQQDYQVNFATKNNERVFFTTENGKAREEFSGAARLQYRKLNNTRHYLTLKYHGARISDSLAQLSTDYLFNKNQRANWLALSYQYVYDKRDYVAYPLKGELLNLSISKPDFALAKTAKSDLLEFYAQYKKYVPLSEKFYLAGSATGKHTMFRNMPYYLQSGLGYSDFVRGYEYYVIDAQSYFIAKSSLKWRWFKPRAFNLVNEGYERFSKVSFAGYLNLNFDLAYAVDRLYTRQNQLANKWIVGGGLGVDLISFYDIVVRGEYSFNRQGESGFFLHFSKPI